MKAGAPSATASLVLQAVLFAARDRAHARLVPKEAERLTEEIARRVLPFPRLFGWAARNRFARGILTALERVLNPGFVLHVAARKALIEQLAREAIRGGDTQLIVVGAGYDTLALRLAAACPGVTCFEIDHPSTQASKRAALAGELMPANLCFISADLAATSLRGALTAEPRFRAAASTLVVIEGVLMYLPPDAVRTLFLESSALFSGGLTCVFTFMDRGADGRIQFQTAHPAVSWWLGRKNERFLWGLERDGIPACLVELGFRSVTTYGSAELIAAFLSGPGRTVRLAEGELIGVGRT